MQLTNFFNLRGNYPFDVTFSWRVHYFSKVTPHRTTEGYWRGNVFLVLYYLITNAFLDFTDNHWTGKLPLPLLFSTYSFLVFVQQINSSLIVKDFFSLFNTTFILTSLRKRKIWILFYFFFFFFYVFLFENNNVISNQLLIIYIF